jgi:hypothetical protein
VLAWQRLEAPPKNAILLPLAVSCAQLLLCLGCENRGSRAMTLLTYPSNHDVFWVVFGWAVLYGSVRALLSDGSNESTQTFDDSSWPLTIIFGWPALYWLMNHGVSGLLN